MFIGAVDIGGTKIAVGIVDEDGRLLAQRQTPTAAVAGFDGAMDRVTELLRQCGEEANVSVQGLGIGCTGPVDPITGRIGVVDFLPGWEDASPVQVLGDRFGVSAAMENDADAASLGEARWGSGKGVDSLICVTVGTGIGGGIVLQGRLFRGVDGAHPEIGHHVIEPEGPPCFCGARGCWEILAAGPAMAAWAEIHAPKDYAHRHDLSARHLCALARQGDAFAQTAVQREARYLGLGIANLVTLFTPERIVLGGSVLQSADLFLPTIHETVRRTCGLVPFEKTTIAMASLGPDTPLIGAAQVWHHRFKPQGA